MKKQLFMLAFAMAAMTAPAQTVIFDGANYEENANGGFLYNRADAKIVTEDGRKCLRMVTKANPNPSGWDKEHYNVLRNISGVNFNGLRRVSFKIKMSKGHNVLLKIASSSGDARRFFYYNGDETHKNTWQTMVFEFGLGTDAEKILNSNTEMEIWPFQDEADVFDYTGETVFIDDIQVEGPLADGTAVRTLSDGDLTGAVTLTGLMGKGNYQCTWDGDWHNVSYDDYVMLNSKLSSGITSVDATGATLNDFDADQFFYKNVNNVLYAPTGTSGSHANVVVDGACGNLNLNAGYAFNAPSGFTVTGSVNIFRTTRAGINSFCLPVEVSEGDLMFKDADPDPLANYLATYKETGTNVVFTKHATVAANTPFILDSKYAVTESNLNTDGYYITIDCSVNNKTVVATPNSLGAGFVGVYAQQSANGLWGITDSGKLQPGNSTATIKAFHAYLSGEVGARASMISFDDEDVTGINEIERMKNVENEKFYNLNGQQVAQPTRGLYIVNGKKVVIK